MTNHCYRLIFNKTLGRMVVVSERSQSQGKPSEPSKEEHSSKHTIEQQEHTAHQPTVLSALKPLTYTVLFALGSLGLTREIHANANTPSQIIADPTALKQEQPIILATANGLPQVNIATPSQAGVSKNQYRQFNVGVQGAILNNSRKAVQTQLAGFVEANPQLARGEAKVILNQINSNEPSKLHGYIEVAGKRAEVVIANPSGIQVDGGGFINANGAILTTGQARYDDKGNISHYDFTAFNQNSTIDIAEQGLNSNGADYTTLISQYNHINAKILAGQGDVEVQTGTRLDVSQLGGMYAGKICLVGTDKGLGVTQPNYQINNAGTLYASGQQAQFSIDTQGNLTNTGILASEQTLQLKANQLTNPTGQIIADQAMIELQQDYSHSDKKQLQTNDLSLSTQGKLTNTAELTSSQRLQLNAQHIKNQGLINSEHTTLTAKDSIDNLGAKIYGTQLNIQAKTLNNTPVQQPSTSQAATSSTAQTTHTAPTIAGRETVNIQADTINHNPNPDRAGKFNSDFSHQSLILSQGTLNIAANTLNNVGASIESAGDMVLDVQTLNNQNADYRKDVRVETERKTGQVFYRPEHTTEEYPAQDILLSPSSRGLSDAVLNTKNTEGQWINRGEHWDKITTDQVILEDFTRTSDPARIVSGGNIHVHGKQLINDKSQMIVGDGFQFLGDQVQQDPHGDLNAYTIKRFEKGSYTSHSVGWNTLGTRHRHQWSDPITQAPTETILNTHRLPILSTLATNQLTQTTVPNLTNLNTTGLFQVSQQPNYFIETDPAFTHGKAWLGSDYMTDRLGYQADHIHKRLGDGYYEQQLIKDQILALTGKRYLSDYRSDDTQYQALMNHGIAQAKSLNLRLGIALTAEQIAQLTTDIVWLVAQHITIKDPNGKDISQTVLVPKVYVRSHTADLTSDGSLITARNIDLNLTGDLTNQGNIIAHNTLKAETNNIHNQQGGVIKGNFVQINAQKNINNIGGVIGANSAMSLNAGKDIINRSSTTHNENKQGQSHSERTDITHIGQIHVGDDLNTNTATSTATRDKDTASKASQNHALTTLSINAGGKYTAVAGQINNTGGSTHIHTNKGIDLQAVKVGYRHEAIGDTNNYHKQSEYQDVGSQIKSVGDVVLSTQGNINATATTINSEQGKAVLTATGKDSSIHIKERRYTQGLDTAYHIQDKGLLSKKETQDRYLAHSDSSIASEIDGKQVIISASKDITLTTANVVSEKQTIVQAGNNLNITSSENTSSIQHQHETKKSGLMGSDGIGFSIGREKNTGQNTQHSTSQVGSMVGSLQGDVLLQAGQNYTQTASTVSTPKGNIDIEAKQATITSADNHYHNTNASEYEKQGFTVAVNVPVLNAIQSTIATAQTIGKSKNDRVNAMAIANTAIQGYQTAQNLAKSGQSISELAKGNLANAAKDANISATITYGEQKNTTKNEIQGNTAEASQVMAGGKVNINATGAGEQSNILIQGSDILGQQGTHLSADNNINIFASEQHHKENSTNRNQGWNAGIAVSYGSNGLAFGVTAGGNYGKGYANGRETTHRNSHVGDLNSQTSIKSGKHLDIKGGQIKGSKVSIDAQSMNLTSLQDTASYQSQIHATHATVTEQTGIFAGDGGVQARINNVTELKGAVITSTAQAEQAGNNHIQTGTLTVSDIDNHSHYSGKSIGMGASASISGKTLGQAPQNNSNHHLTSNKLQTIATKNGVGLQSIGYGSDSASQTSTTKGGIYTTHITISDTTKQKTLAQAQGKSLKDTINQAKISYTTTDFEQGGAAINGALTNRFDKDKVQQEIDGQRDVTKQFIQTTSEVKLEIATQEEKARQEAKDKTAQAEQALAQGDYTLANKLLIDAQTAEEKAQHLQHGKVAVDVVSKALSASSGGTTGQVVSALSPAGAYAIGQYFKNNDSLNSKDGGNRAGEGSKSHLLAHGLLALAVGSATGQSPETITTATISTMGAETLAKPLSKYLYGSDKVEDLTAEQKQTISNVLGTLGLVTGVVMAQATGQNSVSSLSAGQQVQGATINAVENNWEGMLDSSLAKAAQHNIGMDRQKLNDKIGENIYSKNYLAKMIGKIQEGTNIELEAGATGGAIVAIKQTVGQVYDPYTNIICTTDTKCTIAGPYAGATTHLGTSVSTGSVSPNSKVIQFGTTAGLAIGKGAEFSGTLNSDGSFTLGIEGKIGVSGGAGIMVCIKETTNLCISKGK